MVEEFIPGHYYRYAPKIPVYEWWYAHDMLKMLDGVPRKCIEITDQPHEYPTDGIAEKWHPPRPYLRVQHAEFDGITGGAWNWDIDNFSLPESAESIFRLRFLELK